MLIIFCTSTIPQDTNSLCFEGMPRPQEFECHGTPANQAQWKEKIPNVRIFLIWLFQHIYAISLCP